MSEIAKCPSVLFFCLPVSFPLISLFVQCVIEMLKNKPAPDHHLVCSPDCGHAGWSAEGGPTGCARFTHLAGSGKESVR